jgi:hypothetical protein
LHIGAIGEKIGDFYSNCNTYCLQKRNIILQENQQIFTEKYQGFTEN